MVTQAQLHELFDYDGHTGNLIWKVARQGIRVGDVAGCINTRGYRTIRLSGCGYLAHRLIWMHHHGKLPDRQIDHIDRDKLNNRIENLRDVPQSINLLNRDKPNKTGFAGVTKARNKFRAGLGIFGKTVHLGTFDTAEEAHEAFKIAHVAAYGANSEYYEVAA